MKKRNKLNDFFQKQEKRLKVARGGSGKQNILTTKRSNNSTLSLHTHDSSSKKKKGGVVIQGQTIIVKSNYEMAGRMKRDGSRATKKQVGSHASASLNYMNNHGAEDIKEHGMSNIYDEDGKRLTAEEFNKLREDMEKSGDIAGMRRTVIDPGQKDHITREELLSIVKESIHDFQEQTGKDFDYKIAIHTDKVELGGNVHAHVLATGTNQQVNMTKEQLKEFKEIVGEKTEALLQEKELEKDRSIDKLVEKEIQLDKEKELQNLEEKFRDEGLDKAIKQVYEQSHTNNQELKL